MSSPSTPFPGPPTGQIAPFSPATPWPAQEVFEMVLGASAFLFPPIYLQPMASIDFEIALPNYAGTDVISARVGLGAAALAVDNGVGLVEGSTGHYATRYFTAAAGGVVLTDAPFPSGLQWRFGLPTAQQRTVLGTIVNIKGKAKTGQFMNQIGTGDAATMPAIHLGGYLSYFAGDGVEDYISVIQFGTFLNAAKCGAGTTVRIMGTQRLPTFSVTV